MAHLFKRGKNPDEVHLMHIVIIGQNEVMSVLKIILSLIYGQKGTQGTWTWSKTIGNDQRPSLRKLAKGGKVAIALEQSKGGLIFALLKYDFIP